MVNYIEGDSTVAQSFIMVDIYPRNLRLFTTYVINSSS